MGNIATKTEGGYEKIYTVYAGAHIYAGNFVYIKASDGLAYAFTDAAGYYCAGIALEEIDDSPSSTGLMKIRVQCDARVTMAQTGTTLSAASHYAALAYVATATTIDDGTTTSHDAIVGLVIYYKDTSNIIVDMSHRATWAVSP